MAKFTQTHVTLILLGIVVLIGAFLFGLPQKLLKVGPQTVVKQQSQAQTLSVAGRVSSVNVQSNSFVIKSAQDGLVYTVVVGKNTSLVRLVFPFDLKNPPANKTFTPEKKKVALQDLRTGDQVFLRASQPIGAGQHVANPVEIQILP